MSPAEDLDSCRSALRSLALELSRAQDHERVRIARGLHDDLGQVLASLQVHIGRLDNEELDVDAAEIVETLAALVREAIESSRTLSFELVAPIRPDLGIERELEQFATRLTEDGVPCRVEIPVEPMPLAPLTATAVVRAVRELTHNVKKHADASSARMVVDTVGDRIRIEVSDDGVGLAAAETTAPESMGIGLLIVHERLAEVGGDVEIDSSPGGGTRIVVTAPLLDDRSAP